MSALKRWLRRRKCTLDLILRVRPPLAYRSKSFLTLSRCLRRFGGLRRFGRYQGDVRFAMGDSEGRTISRLDSHLFWRGRHQSRLGRHCPVANHLAASAPAAKLRSGTDGDHAFLFREPRQPARPPEVERRVWRRSGEEWWQEEQMGSEVRVWREGRSGRRWKGYAGERHTLMMLEDGREHAYIHLRCYIWYSKGSAISTVIVCGYLALSAPARHHHHCCLPWERPPLHLPGPRFQQLLPPPLRRSCGGFASYVRLFKGLPRHRDQERAYLFPFCFRPFAFFFSFFTGVSSISSS